MSREILQDIISDFSPDKFTRFFRTKHRSFSPRQEPFSQYNDPAFADGLKIGEIAFSADEKLLVCAFQSIQPLSERSSRKAQYEKGKKILKDTQSDAGIFIFHDSRGNFRFSLIYPEVTGARRQWSNFRRFTYFASTELTNKTFLTRVGDGDFFSLEKIKDAFSVEKVTKEFYEQYRKLFEASVVDLNGNQTFRNEASRGRINTHDFAKKLLGQIVFLYFLQKKGWLGVPQNKPWGEGDKNFISNLYRQAVTNKENFFNDYLEILFYDTLNNAHREGADPSFSRYFNCRIPFLNGGLFEPEYDWHGTTIHLDNGIFKNIFEVFDRYNFTVEEERPDDKEVAVDPEMLGKVFENLLEENLRKGKGTYYTPREIVHYMCRESLVNFLVFQSGLEEGRIRALILRHESGFSAEEAKTLEWLLKDVKVCDPACGSGAFLVGMLNEIIHARLALDPSGSEYTLKKETIQNCVYGVDIDPGAVEIAKLRLWLSLVVDYELADIEPLPNLDYKIMCGNSLLEELIVGDESIPLFDPDVLMKDKPKRKSSDKLMQMDFLKQDADEYLKILCKLHVEYFHETDTQKKKTLRSRIEKIEMDFIQASVDSRVKELDGQIKNLNMHKPEDRKKNAALMTKKLEYMAIPGGIRDSKVRPYFLWHLNFFEVFQEKGGFDIVIANPPYVSHDKIKEKKALKNAYASYEPFADLYCYFIELAINLQGNKGLLCYITSNSYLRADYGSFLRDIIRTKNRLDQVINIEDFQIFDSAIVNTAILISSKRLGADLRGCLIVNSKYMGDVHFQEFVDKNRFDYSQKDFCSKSWTLVSKEGLKLKNKIEEIGKSLESYNTKIRLGLATGANEVFAIGEDIKNELIRKDPRNRNIIKPLLRGRDISRYSYQVNGLHIILTKNGINVKKEYPEIYKYLDSFEKDFKERGAQGEHWSNLRACAFFDDFKKEKIIWIELADRGRFALCVEEIYLLNSAYFLLPPDRFSAKYLLGILNSKVIEFYLHSIAETSGMGTNRWINNYVKEFPIPEISSKEQEPIVKIVNKIMQVINEVINDNNNSKEQDKIQEYERQIDQMVYKLYGLTEEEIKIVEEGSRQTKGGHLHED